MSQADDTDASLIQILRTTRRIALVGASDKPHRASYRVMQYLLRQGYQVIPLAPRLAGKTLSGQQVYASLGEIPGTDAAEPVVDMVDIFLNADAALAIVQQAIAIGVKTVWLQIGVINEQAAVLARQAGLQVVMDRCPAIEIPRLGLEK